MREFTSLTEEEINEELELVDLNIEEKSAVAVIDDSSTDETLIIDFSYPPGLNGSESGSNNGSNSGSESGSYEEDNENIPIGTITFTIKDGKLRGTLNCNEEQIDRLTKCFHIVADLLKEGKNNSKGGGSRKKKSKKSKRSKKSKKSRKTKKSRR
jgi:hypothetical protein